MRKASSLPNCAYILSCYNSSRRCALSCWPYCLTIELTLLWLNTVELSLISLSLSLLSCGSTIELTLTHLSLLLIEHVATLLSSTTWSICASYINDLTMLSCVSIELSWLGCLYCLALPANLFYCLGTKSI